MPISYLQSFNKNNVATFMVGCQVILFLKPVFPFHTSNKHGYNKLGEHQTQVRTWQLIPV
jgi:hypothetical protein